MATVTINNVPGAGYVSAGVYKNGVLQATILNAFYYSSGGNKTVTWNETNNQGQSVTGPYTVEALYMPGFGGPDSGGHPRIYKAKLLGAVGVNTPAGPGYWEHSVGGHSGNGGVAIDATGVYIGSRGAENVPELAKFNLSITSRIWSAWVADNRRGDLGGDFHGGAYALEIMDGEVYRLHKNQKIYITGVNNPNVKDQSVGIEASPNNYTGRMLNVSQPGNDTDWHDRGKEYGQNMDIKCVFSRVYVSYRDLNKVMVYNKTTGAVIQTFTVPTPVGLTVESDENILVTSGTKVIRINKDTGALTDAITGLVSPRVLDCDRFAGGNGEIYVYEAGSQQTVKRFSKTGATDRAPIRQYGKTGGQQYGMFKARNLKAITDLCCTGDGFMAALALPPYRVVWFNKDGSLKKNVFTNKHWIPSTMPDPKCPGDFWMTEDGYDVCRYKFDFTSGKWSCHSVYKFVGLGSGLADSRYAGAGGDGIGGGNDDWVLKRHGNKKFLARRWRGELYVIDDINFTVKMAAQNNLLNNGSNSTQWCDVDGNGLTGGTGESRSFPYGRTAEKGMGFHGQRMDDLTIYSYDYLGNRIMGLPVTSTTAAGVPRHRDINSWDVIVPTVVDLSNNRTLDPYQNYAGALPPEVFNGVTFHARGTSYYEKSTQVCCATDQYVFVGVTEQCKSTTIGGVNRNRCSPGDQWGLCYKAELHVYNRSTGALIARAGRFTPRPKGQFPSQQPRPAPGLMYSIKQVSGSITINGHTIVILNDFDSGWGGSPTAINYAWNHRGLWVGGMFNNFDTSTGYPIWRGCHNSENGTGQYVVWNGKVYCFTSGENDGRIYEIEGFAGWVNLTGTVS